MPHPHLQIEHHPAGYRWLRLDRPERRNALDPQFLVAIREALADSPGTPAVLASADPRVFCAGADLTISDAERAVVSDLIYDTCETMVTRPGAVIAVLTGAAVGGGAQLAAAADIRIAGPGARLRWTGPPGLDLAVGAWLLPDLVGRGAALDITLTGRWVQAAEALALGLVSSVTGDAERAAAQVAADLAARGTGSGVKAVTAAGGLLDRLRAEREVNRAAWERANAVGQRLPWLVTVAGYREWSLAGWREHLPGRAGVASFAAGLGDEPIPALAAASAAAEPGRIAVTVDGEPLTHAELDFAAARVAGWLAGRVQPGDRVLLAAGASIGFVRCYLGALKAGAVVVLASPQYQAAELGHLVADSGAVLAFADPGPGRLLAALGLPVFGVAELPSGGRVAEVTVGPRDVALLAYTSGTTGTPKGVPLTHGQLAFSIRSAMAAWRWSADDVLAHALPLYHQHGLSGLHAALIAGGTVHIRSRFSPADLVRTIDECDATALFAVPTIYQALMSAAAPSASSGPPASPVPLAPLRRLRVAVCGSAPLNPALAGRLAETLGRVPLIRYGTTETGLNVSNPIDSPRGDTVGVPLPGVLARIWAADGEAELGGDGEIQLRGPQVLSGYWHDPAATRAAFTPDGWFRTGDIGAVDPAIGHLRIKGRTKEMIITGGLNVYPREVEIVLEEHPSVAEAAVAGLPHERWGEQVTAWVVLRDGHGFDEAALIAHTRARLAAYKCPKQVFQRAALPRNHVGKIVRGELRLSRARQHCG